MTSVEGVRNLDSHRRTMPPGMAAARAACHTAMRVPAADRAARLDGRGMSRMPPPSTTCRSYNPAALFFSPAAGPERCRPAAGPGNILALRGVLTRRGEGPPRASTPPQASGRLFQRLLEEHGVREHAVEVAAQSGQSRPEVAEREPAAQRGEPARVPLEEVREQGQRHQLEAAQVDHDALGRAPEYPAPAADQLAPRARLDGP